MLRTPTNPEGVPLEVFDQIRTRVLEDRSGFFSELSLTFYGYNRPGKQSSEAVRESFWLQGMMAGLPASYFCVRAFSESDLTADLKAINVPTLIIHGDDDQIVPIQVSALETAKLIAHSQLVILNGASHGLCTTEKARINKELLNFIQSPI